MERLDHLMVHYLFVSNGKLNESLGTVGMLCVIEKKKRRIRTLAK